jgi:hypothetical protein
MRSHIGRAWVCVSVFCLVGVCVCVCELASQERKEKGEGGDQGGADRISSKFHA